MITAVSQNADSIRTDYLNLLVTQLKNQNPLKPMDNNEMALQLAALSQLEQMENLNGSFQQVLESQELDQATSLIGKTVEFFNPGAVESTQGLVQGVDKSNGKVLLVIGEQRIALNEIVGIQ